MSGLEIEQPKAFGPVPPSVYREVKTISLPEKCLDPVASFPTEQI